MGLFGSPNVDKLKTSRDVAGLVRALTYTGGDLGKARDTRVAAATALASLRDPQALPALTAVALRDPEGADGGKRRGGEPDRISPPEDALVRATAQAIAAIGSEGVDALVSALRGDNGREAKSRAALALGELRHAPVLTDIVAMRVAVEDKIKSMSHRQAFLESWYQFRNILNWSIDRIDPSASTPRPARDPVTGEASCAICGRTDAQVRPSLRATFPSDRQVAELRLVRVCPRCGEAFCINHMHVFSLTPWNAHCGCGKHLPIEPTAEPAAVTSEPPPPPPTEPAAWSLSGVSVHDELANFQALVERQGALLEGLAPIEEEAAQSVFAAFGIDRPNRYEDALTAFSGFRQYAMTAEGVPVEVSNLKLTDASARSDFLYVHLADVPPLGFLVCALKEGGFLGYYKTGTALKDALGI